MIKFTVGNKGCREKITKLQRGDKLMSRQSAVAIIRYERIRVNKPRGYEVVKRIMDIICSMCGIILLLPLFIVVAILIKLEDRKGKVFFIQERCGKDGQRFKMYKFRSMVHNAEELLEGLQEKNERTGPVFKIGNDPRITRVGRFIRKTSIDELPQLFNVLKGEMSLVGPRPPLIKEVRQYDEYQEQRLLVKPGLTCIWQVSGRNSISFDEWVEMDLEYISNRTIYLDISLIFKTIFVLFGDENAS